MDDHNPKTILLVEDEALIALNEARMLRKEGYEVVLAASGEEAIASVIAASGAVSLILMDIDLGKGRMEGTQAAAEILREYDIPVLFLSSHTEPEVMAKTEKITSYGYVLKNTGFTVLLGSIKMAFKLHRAHQALQRTNEKLSLAQEASQAGAWEWDIANNTFDWSPEFMKILGVSADVAPAIDTLVNAIHADDRDMVAKDIEKALNKNTAGSSSDFRIVLPDQKVRQLRVTGKTFFDGNRPVRMLGLGMDITERKQAEDELRSSQEQFALVFHSNPTALAVTRFVDGTFLSINESYTRIMGYAPGEILGRNVAELDIYLYKDQRTLILQELRQQGCVRNFELHARSKTGQGRHLLAFMDPIQYNGEEAILSVFVDITERKEAAAQMAKTLTEKETLLRELYHRTKNNMGVIIALLELQASYFDDQRLKAAFEEARNRIYSMALVHEKLYEAEDLSQINLHDYLTELVQRMYSSYVLAPGQISLVFEMQDVFVLINTAIPCGLVINELFSNSLKYAFPDQRRGQIFIGIRRLENQEIELEYRDDGVGLPPGFDARSDGQMGLQTVFALAEGQLNARTNFSSVDGVAFKIQFRDNLYKARV